MAALFYALISFSNEFTMALIIINHGAVVINITPELLQFAKETLLYGTSNIRLRERKYDVSMITWSILTQERNITHRQGRDAIIVMLAMLYGRKNGVRLNEYTSNFFNYVLKASYSPYIQLFLMKTCLAILRLPIASNESPGFKKVNQMSIRLLQGIMPLTDFSNCDSTERKVGKLINSMVELSNTASVKNFIQDLKQAIDYLAVNNEHSLP